MFSEGNVPKNGEPTLNTPSRQCSSKPVGFGQVFLYIEQCYNTAASPIFPWPGCSWFWHVSSTEINFVGTALLWCYWHH